MGTPELCSSSCLILIPALILIFIDPHKGNQGDHVRSPFCRWTWLLKDALTVPHFGLYDRCFLPDLLWIALARAGIEPEFRPHGFFHDWSHSAFMSCYGPPSSPSAFGRKVGLLPWRFGLPASHISPSILPIHPARLALYPHASAHLGWDIWTWGQMRSRLGPAITGGSKRPGSPFCWRCTSFPPRIGRTRGALSPLLACSSRDCTCYQSDLVVRVPARGPFWQRLVGHIFIFAEFLIG